MKKLLMVLALSLGLLVQAVPEKKSEESLLVKFRKKTAFVIGASAACAAQLISHDCCPKDRDAWQALVGLSLFMFPVAIAGVDRVIGYSTDAEVGRFLVEGMKGWATGFAGSILVNKYKDRKEFVKNMGANLALGFNSNGTINRTIDYFPVGNLDTAGLWPYQTN